MTKTTIEELVFKVGVSGANKFKADSEKVKKSTQIVKQHADKFEKSLKSVGSTGLSSIRTLTTGMLGLAGVTVSLAGSVSAFGSISDSILKIGNSSAYLGMTSKELDGINNAVKAMGGKSGDADRLLGTLQQIDGSLSNPVAYGGVSPMFKTLQQLQSESGKFIRTNRGVKATLMDTIAAIGALKNKNSQVGYANALGITPAMLEAIREGRASSLINSFSASSGQNNVSFKEAQEFNKNLTQLSQSFDKLGIQLFNAFEPSMNKIVTDLDSMVNFFSLGKAGNAFKSLINSEINATTDGKKDSNLTGFLKYLIAEGASQLTGVPFNLGYNIRSEQLRAAAIKSRMTPSGDSKTETNINTMNVTTNSNNINGIVDDGRKKAMRVTMGSVSGVNR